MADKVPDERVYEYLCREKEVRQWVEDVLAIPLKSDLHQLQNGIVLCYLMRAIDPDSIPVIQEQTKHAFKLKENVQFFLDAIADFGVPPHRRFLISDLWDMRNMANVISCLNSLAQIASTKGFKHPLRPVTDDKANRPLIDAATMKSLKDQLSRIKEGPSTGTYRKEAPGIFQRKLALLMGGDPTKFEQFLNRWKKIQAISRGHLARNNYRKLVRQQAFRTKVAQEVYDTENTYVKSLKNCIDFYLVPLRDGKDGKKALLQKPQINTLFSSIEVIYNFNDRLRQDLDVRIKAWSASQCLGDIFLRIMDFLKVYTSYIQTYDAALKLYEDLRLKNKAFVQMTDEIKLVVPGSYDLTSFLIMPVQRIPRYSLLLQQLSKNTWTDHPDHKDLDKAYTKVNDIAVYLNEKKRTFENMQQLINVQEGLEGGEGVQLVAPNRTYIGRYEVDDHKKAEASVFLFSDLVLYGKVEKKKKEDKEVVKYKNHWNIADVILRVNKDKERTVFEIVSHTDGSFLAKFYSRGPEPHKLSEDLAAAKEALKAARDSFKSTGEFKPPASPNLVPGANAAAPGTPEDDEEDIEERLRLREQQKKEIKEQMAQGPQGSPPTAHRQVAGSPTPNITVSGPTTPTATTLSPADRKKFFHSAPSLFQLKAIVEKQMDDVEAAKKKKKKGQELEQISTNLTQELADIDTQLSEVMKQLSPEEAEALKKKEAEAKAQEAAAAAARKKHRRSFVDRLFSRDPSPSKSKRSNSPTPADQSANSLKPASPSSPAAGESLKRSTDSNPTAASPTTPDKKK